MTPKPPTSPTSHDPRQKILVLGWRKAGKTSCIKTVFQQVPAQEVPHFGVTQKIEQIDYNSIIPLQIWDTPSNFEIDQLEVPLSSFSTIVYVLDMQQDDSYHDSIRKFVHIMVRAYLSNPAIRFHMFIHKAEMLSEDYRGENYAEIQRTTAEEIEDFRYGDFQSLAPGMTSAHDVSLRAAWSKVIQGSMEMLPAVESLLLDFTSHSSTDNTFLFDMKSRVILATDNRHRTDELTEQVTEYLASFLQFQSLYKAIAQRPVEDNEDGEDGEDEDGEGEEDGGDDEEEEEEEEGREWWDDEDPDAPWMTQSTRLLPSTTLAMWQFTPYLALVVLLRTDTWQVRRGTIEYNLTFLRQGVREILTVV
ncbi:hypothetical protein L198_01177 [Cryptococcus wingfieldii CBS 7118]|uniref:GTP-binding protein n=1 Tax=Cryptococcus wingfieldii CBS 7118 TaxID=1295528 RepID=A0A1E3K400_9TREE|nr:hypothetical protein L198_01177 [Cryptococcus wingfieldii CBS 7118]ODO07596.1 hypothetical protein L198_01177 [Cryptococcus wingfieldii CBS 7118]